MSQLEEIKARAETALLHENLDPSVYAELAWAVVPDVPKLAAALEAILYACTQVDTESHEAQQDWLVSTIETVVAEALA